MADPGACFGTDGTLRGEGVVGEAGWVIQGERTGCEGLKTDQRSRHM